jgi:hypothetical protein
LIATIARFSRKNATTIADALSKESCGIDSSTNQSELDMQTYMFNFKQ